MVGVDLTVMAEFTRWEKRVLDRAARGRKTVPMWAVILIGVLGGMASGMAILAAFLGAPPGEPVDLRQLAYGVVLAGFSTLQVTMFLMIRAYSTLIQKLRAGEQTDETVRAGPGDPTRC